MLSLGILLLCILGAVFGEPLKVTNNAEAMDYIRKYTMGDNYKNDKFGQLVTEDEIKEALMMFQRTMGLDVTGSLDDQTMEAMNWKRCGVKDVIDDGDDMKRRKKRYALQGSKWNNQSPLSYRFKASTYSRDLPNSLVESIMAKAFKYWSDVANIDFRRTTGNSADIDILFASGQHDGEGPDGAFDGSGGTLAHAFFPQFGGDAHFDEDETWTDGTSRGINLLQVAIHEIGHSLGLSHSSVRGSIMYPSYSGYVPNVVLDSDDITGIRALYGAKTATPPPTAAPTPAPTPAPTAPPAPASTTVTTTSTTISTTALPNNAYQRFCSNLRLDAITLFDGRTFAFQDDLYVELGASGIEPGFPRPISQGFPGAPNNVDAALFWEDHAPSRLYLFKGSQYWRYQMTSGGTIYLKSGYPRLISSGFRGVPNNIDSAFVWGRNGKSYIFKDNVYYRLYKDPSTNRTRGRVDTGYPRSYSVWSLPEQYDSVFVWRNGRTYFFKGDQYVRYNDFQLEVDDDARNPYPRSVNTWWTNCDHSSLVQNMEMAETNNDKEFIVMPQADDTDGEDGDVNTIGGAAGTRQAALVVIMSAILTLLRVWEL